MTYFPVPQDLPPAIGTNITYCKKKGYLPRFPWNGKKFAYPELQFYTNIKRPRLLLHRISKNDFVSKDLLKTTPAPVECHDKLFIEIYTSGF